MPLRPYQADMLNASREAYKQGRKAPCIVAPCGAGKSVIVAEMAKSAASKGNSVLFLVHRKELCEQIERTFREWGVDMRLCYVGMVQTICRRLGRFRAPDLIITDENHHSTAASYRKIYDNFPAAKRIGVTATPVRLDGSGLADVNDILITGVSTKWLIENEHLAPFDYFSPSVADLTGLKENRGEYAAADVEARLIKKAIFGDVISYYQKLSDGKQAICYCSSIKHSKIMSEQFCESGIWAEHIDGETPKPERAYIVERFRSGEIKVLCNVDLISEGFDVPDCNTAILLRPTKSLTLYIQQSMRCMRYKPGKRAVIIDHVGNYARFGLPDADREWKLDAKKGEKQQNATAVKICPKCYYTVPAAIAECPACKCAFGSEKKERTVEEIKETALEVIKGFALDYSIPDDCHTYRELLAYAERKGYKRGWAYIQARQRGLIHA
jgi:superfamily II DNA or RNA helicase